MVPWDKHREVAGVPGLSIHRTAGNAYEHVTLNQRQFAGVCATCACGGR